MGVKRVINPGVNLANPAAPTQIFSELLALAECKLLLTNDVITQISIENKPKGLGALSHGLCVSLLM